MKGREEGGGGGDMREETKLSEGGAHRATGPVIVSVVL